MTPLFFFKMNSKSYISLKHKDLSFYVFKYFLVLAKVPTPEDNIALER